MPKLKVKFHHLASKEFEDGLAWYKKRSPQASDNFLEEVEIAAHALATRYETLPIIEDYYRWVRVARYPFRLIGRVFTPGYVLVVSVEHTSRRSGYWKRRK